MTVAVVDVLETIHIEHNQHPASPGHLRCAVQIAALVQQTGEGIQLIPHLGAVDVVQHRQQRDAQPGDAQIRHRNLNNGFRRQKHDQGIDQGSASILKRARRQDGGQGQVKNRRKIHRDIDVKVLSPGIYIVCAHEKHRSKGDGKGEKQQIGDFAAHRKPELLTGCGFLILHIHQTDGHRRRQAKPQKIGGDVQPPIFCRSAVYRQRHHFHRGNTGNQRECQKKSPLLLLVQGLAQPCKEPHKAQNKKINGG